MREGLILAILGVAMVSGCGKPYVTDERLEQGLVLVFPGIEGRSPCNLAIRNGLADGGVEQAIEIRDWTSCGLLTLLYNLRGERRNRAEAARIARLIVDYQDAHPGRPVTLVGQSGGTAIAAWVAEAMPAGRQVDGIVMLASALSPSYRLDKALSASRRGIVSFFSKWDCLFLGAGTFVFGTSGGRHVSAAGRLGFNPPPAQDGSGPYSRLYQIPWERVMAKKGNIGSHLTSGASWFVAGYVAPLVMADQWDADLVRRVVAAGGQSR